VSCCLSTGFNSNAATAFFSKQNEIFKQSFFAFTIWNPDNDGKGEKKEVTYTIHLPENYERQEYCNLVKIVDEEHGNPLKVWHDLGEPANPSKDEVSLLREVAKPWITTQTDEWYK